MQIVGRKEWGATGVQSRHGKMRLPATSLVLHHTVTATSTDPAKDMRTVEKVGMQRFGQFSYSYCIHGDGTVLEGAGRLVGAHTEGRNSSTFGVALLGDYDKRGVTVWQIDAVRQLVAWLIEEGDLVPGIHPTAGHRDVIDPDTGKPTATACPGARAYRLMDAFRVPWNLKEGIAVADNPELHNLEGPLSFHLLQDQNGFCTGYVLFGTTTGEVHGYGPGWKYWGRSEDPTPDDEQ